jgi:ABC-type transport system involved in multi-copper enzyme maturation permease subunit
MEAMNLRTLLLVGIVVLTVLARLLPHPPNFTPIGAVALFGATYFRSRWAAFLVPLAAMFLSDLALQLTTTLGLYGGWMAGGTGFHKGMVVVYGTIVLIAALGLLLRRKKTVLTVAAATLAASILFFVITNFAVWAEGEMYPMTPEGLLACYTAAIPFFHWTLLGDAFYATVLFGSFALAERRFPVLQPATA